MTNDQKKEDGKKLLFIFVIIIIIASVFFIVLLLPSNHSKALLEINQSKNINEVQSVWFKYKNTLNSDEEFLSELRFKISSFNLNDKELSLCKSWLPPASTSINIIVIPDLSRRINDDINNPNQINSDINVLKAIWRAFVNYSSRGKNTKDGLIVDVTDDEQAQGKFYLVADSLRFDLSEHINKSNRLYFNKNKEKQFEKNVENLYKYAKIQPIGADYKLYFRRHLDRIKKSTIHDDYINKVIIITDGYLEPEDGPIDTKINLVKSHLNNSFSANDVSRVINKYGLSIPIINGADFSNTEFLICEVNERKSGKGSDYEILKAYWEDWLNNMKAKKVIIIPKEQALKSTVNSINDFIGNRPD